MKKNDRVDICQEVTVPEIRKLRELGHQLDRMLSRTEYNTIVEIYLNCINRVSDK